MKPGWLVFWALAFPPVAIIALALPKKQKEKKEGGN